MEESFQSPVEANEGTVYPEPDYVPDYPWLGRQGLGEDLLPSSQDRREAVPVQHGGSSLWRRNHDADLVRRRSASDDRGNRNSGLGTSLENSKDASIDPDFEGSEKSRL